MVLMKVTVGVGGAKRQKKGQFVILRPVIKNFQKNKQQSQFSGITRTGQSREKDPVVCCC